MQAGFQVIYIAIIFCISNCRPVIVPSFMVILFLSSQSEKSQLRSEKLLNQFSSHLLRSYISVVDSSESSESGSDGEAADQIVSYQTIPRAKTNDPSFRGPLS